MKRILMAGAFALAAAGPALAADLPPPMAPPPRAPATYMPAPIPFYNWGGFYIGLNAGYDFGTATPTGTAATAAGLGNFNASGFLGGGTAGFNYQWAALVVGLEGDFDYNSISNTQTVTAGSATFKSNWMATARGRIGYAWDRVLLFGTGGAAFAPANVTSSVPAYPGGSTTMTGWTAGAGIEVALAPHWTAKAEYLYVSFPSATINGASFKATDNLVRAGVNFKFGL